MHCLFYTLLRAAACTFTLFLRVSFILLFDIEPVGVFFVRASVKQVLPLSSHWVLICLWADIRACHWNNLNRNCLPPGLVKLYKTC